jgi:hypothetical protein
MTKYFQPGMSKKAVFVVVGIRENVDGFYRR